MMYNWSSMGDIGDIGVKDFNVGAITNIGNFADGSKFSTAAYDDILTNWSAQTLLPLASSVDFGGSIATDNTNIQTLFGKTWEVTDGSGILVGIEDCNTFASPLATAGNYYINTTAGNVAAGWPDVGSLAISVNEEIHYNGTIWAIR